MVQGVKVLKRRRDVVFSQVVSLNFININSYLFIFSLAVNCIGDIILSYFESAFG